MTQTLIHEEPGTAVGTVDDEVHFDAGPVVKRRTIQIDARNPIVIVEPFLGPIVDGSRILNGDTNTGIGRAFSVAGSQMMGLFSSVYGVEFESALSGAKVLPDQIWVGIRDADGVETYFDWTAEILDMSIEELRSLRDGVLSAPLASLSPFAPLDVDIVTPVSLFFGRMPSADAQGLVVSPEISEADLIQSRYLHAEFMELDAQDEMAMVR